MIDLTGYTLTSVPNGISADMMKNVAGVAINGVLILASVEATTGT
jgi:hypothetical protein